MKRLFSLLLAVMLGMAAIQAQTNLPEQENYCGNEPTLFAEAGTDLSASLETMVDASFLTENGLDYELIEQSGNPKKVAAGVLSILLGDIGVGHFYTGQTLRGILDILFCWTGIPGIIGIVEGIIWLCDTDEEWAARVADWNSR